jgi:hypothetical protein
MIPVTTQQHLQILKQRFPRQPSMDEGCYTHSSSTSNTSSSGSGNGNGSKFKMSAALTQAMVTAAMPLARPAPASAPGKETKVLASHTRGACTLHAATSSNKAHLELERWYVVLIQFRFR